MAGSRFQRESCCSTSAYPTKLPVTIIIVDHSGPQRLGEPGPPAMRCRAQGSSIRKIYCDVSVLSNFGPCLIWKRPSTVSQIQPE